MTEDKPRRDHRGRKSQVLLGKTKGGMLTIRTYDDVTHRKLALIAKNENTTLNSLTMGLLKRFVETYEDANGPVDLE